MANRHRSLDHTITAIWDSSKLYLCEIHRYPQLPTVVDDSHRPRLARE